MAAKAHAILSASSSDRWLHCPPSARLCETYEDKGSDYAAEGTDAHALGEHKLKTALGLPSDDPTDSLKWYSEEMEDCTSGYAEYVLVHAGLLPQWSIAQAHTLAEEVAHELRHRPDAYFAHMYGNKPRAWSAQLNGYDRLRVITNAFTRMRALTYANEIDCDFKAGLADMPNGLRAWFEAPERQNLSHTIVFGHWSALGFFDQCGVLALDTGALWRGPLTAVNLADRQISQVESGSRLHWQTTLA